MSREVQNSERQASERPHRPLKAWFFLICLLAGSLFSDSSAAGGCQFQDFWGEPPSSGTQKPFDSKEVNSDRTGWGLSSSGEMKSISQMGFRDKLSDEDQSNERHIAKNYVPWNFNGWFSWLNNWFANPPAAATPASSGPGALFWTILLTVGAVVLVVLVAIFVRKFVGPGITKKEMVASVRKRKPKLEDLPFRLEKVELTEESLWRLVIEHREKGDYSKAIIYLFSFLLLNFDRQNHLILKAGKTNRTYLAELDKDLKGRGLFAKMMLSFEDAFFGKKETKSAEVDAFISQCQNLPGFSVKHSLGGR